MKKFFLLFFLAIFSMPVFAQQSDDIGKVNVGHKIAHFTVGFGVAWGCGLANHHKTGLAIGVGLGLAKEYYDHRHSNETWVSQKRDILITSSGALLGYLISKHYYPDGADLGRRSDMSLYQQEQNDKVMMAEFKNFCDTHPDNRHGATN